MGMPSLRKFDVQARFGLTASIAAIVPCLAGFAALFRNYNHELRAIPYGKEGMFQIIILGCVLAAGGLSVVGLGLGFNSAGQRRNKDSGKSWIGFFIGTGVLSLTIIMFYAFWKLRFQIVTGA